MDEDEKREQAQDEGLLSNLKNKTKQANKSLFKMILKKAFLAALPILLKILLPVLLATVIVAGFTVIMNEIGSNRIEQQAVSTLIEDEENISIQEENGEYYYQIDQSIVDQYLYELNRAYDNGYFYSSSPEHDEDDEEYVYDEDTAHINRQKIANWFQTEDYEPYLIRMIQAEIASTSPKLSGYYGDSEGKNSARKLCSTRYCGIMENAC